MINDATRDRIGRQLRVTYERMPKGGIPERIWLLLLLIEHDWCAKVQRKDPRQRGRSNGEVYIRLPSWRGGRARWVSAVQRRPLSNGFLPVRRLIRIGTPGRSNASRTPLTR